MQTSLPLEEFVTTQSYISRRDLLRFINEGRVFINDESVDNLKAEVKLKKDTVVVDGDVIQYQFSYV